MDFAEFVEALQLNWDAVVALASLLAVGIAATVQTLKVTIPAVTSQVVGYVALGTGAVLGGLVTAGYFFPQFLPLGMVIFGIVLATDAAVLGYEYLGKNLMSRLFPKTAVSTSDLRDEG